MLQDYSGGGGSDAAWEGGRDSGPEDLLQEAVSEPGPRGEWQLAGRRERAGEQSVARLLRDAGGSVLKTFLHVRHMSVNESPRLKEVRW